MSRPNFPKDDLYKVLGVDSKASLDDIRKAYRELCMKVHPDKAEGGSTPENNERFQKVQEAWEILRDDVLRKEYDDYRANGRSKRDGDDGRRRKDDQKDRTGKHRGYGYGRSNEPGRDRWKNRANHHHSPEGDTYGSKPSDRSKPYYEEWGEEPNDPGYESGQSQHRHHHRHHTGSFFYGAGAQYHGSQEYRRPRSQDGAGSTPSHTVKLEDRIIAMRMRVDLRNVGQGLDSLHSDLAGLRKRFLTVFELSKPDREHLNKLLDDVHRAIEHAEDLYDDLHLRLREVEDGRWTAPSVIYDLPEVLGILTGHVTRMKYAASAAFIILGQLSGRPSPATEDQLMRSFQERLAVMARPTWLPTYLRSS
ncbi:DnaJ-domain-containing protein [Hypoxylon rubiginosum]|uniref:DnaJ-domain-containing protein n=1 Tax=Hypoxylon rubiginosum TaxID=110542 RepID=A0ACB9YV18_9PEZI|nr:DnaJ-domain-containing protein [Hypoxylon rubiginosum]